MDETVVNGAQIFYKRQFGIMDDKESVPADVARKSTFKLVFQWRQGVLLHEYDHSICN